MRSCTPTRHGVPLQIRPRRDRAPDASRRSRSCDRKAVCERRASRNRYPTSTRVVDPPTLTRDLTDTCAPYLQAGSPAFSLRGRLVSTYATREALLDTLLASCYIPMYYETPTLLAGRLHLDGGLFDNQPVLPGGVTVTVSPAQHAATVSPHVRCATPKPC